MVEKLVRIKDEQACLTSDDENQLEQGYDDVKGHPLKAKPDGAARVTQIWSGEDNGGKNLVCYERGATSSFTSPINKFKAQHTSGK